MPIREIIKYGLQPGLLVGSMIVWFAFNRSEAVQLLNFVGVQLILYLCEKFYPAHREWNQKPIEKATILGITVFDVMLFGFVTAIYSDISNTFFINLRESVGMAFWPSEWPILAQVFLMVLISEFVFYWVHRLIHESRIIWRISAHGFHHSFKNLHAINFLTAHPFEAFFVIFPTAFVSLLFGVPAEIVVGAGIFGLVLSSIAHANIDTNSKWIGLVFTTSVQHRRHHSMILEESNSNYSCKIILFDRLFGTYSGTDEIDETGISKEEPTLLQKLWMPISEPGNSYSGADR